LKRGGRTRSFSLLKKGERKSIHIGEGKTADLEPQEGEKDVSLPSSAKKKDKLRECADSEEKSGFYQAAYREKKTEEVK